MRLQIPKKVFLYIFIFIIYLLGCMLVFENKYLGICLELFIFFTLIYYKINNQDILGGINFIYLYMMYIYIFNMTGSIFYYNFYGKNIDDNLQTISHLYFITLTSIIIIVSAFKLVTKKRYIKMIKYTESKAIRKIILIFPLLLSILMFIYMFGGISGIFQIISNYENIEIYRKLSVSRMSGLDWVLLKLGFNSIGISLILSYKKVIYSKLNLFIKVLSGIIILLCFLYGGRFMAFYLILLIILVRNKYHRKIEFKQGVTIFMLLIIFSGVYAGTRYYSQYYDNIGSDLMIESFLRQSMGEIGELNEALSVISIGDTKDILTNEFLINALPRPIYKILFGCEKDYSISMGGYIQSRLHRPSSVRIGAIGEIYISFGYVGILFVIILISFLLLIIDKLYNSINYKKVYFSILIMLGLPTIYLMGCNYSISYLQLLIIYYFINRLT